MYIYGYNVLAYALWGASLAVSAFAIWKGDAAVRWAAIIHIATYFLTLMDRFLDGASVASFELARGLVSAFIYLMLAVRYANLWIGGAMLFQSAEFSLLAYYLVTDRPADRLHAWINNSCEWGIVITIFVGTVLAIRRRMTLAREAAELEARRQQRAAARP